MPVPFFQTLKSWVRLILNGRPMTFQRPVFFDPESGFQVNQYIDQNGREWHATSRWALARVPAN